MATPEPEYGHIPSRVLNVLLKVLRLLLDLPFFTLDDLVRLGLPVGESV
jgi:hypothetical protein